MAVPHTSRNGWIARTCRAGWLLGATGLLVAGTVMIAVARDPGQLGTWAASVLLLVVYGAFVADRFLSGILSRIDRFEIEAAKVEGRGVSGASERDRRAA